MWIFQHCFIHFWNKTPIIWPCIQNKNKILITSYSLRVYSHNSATIIKMQSPRLSIYDKYYITHWKHSSKLIHTSTCHVLPRDWKLDVHLDYIRQHLRALRDQERARLIGGESARRPLVVQTCARRRVDAHRPQVECLGDRGRPRAVGFGAPSWIEAQSGRSVEAHFVPAFGLAAVRDWPLSLQALRLETENVCLLRSCNYGI